MIVFIEPECKKFEHADVNSSLLLLFNQLYKNESFVFLGEKSHLTIINETILKYDLSINFTEFNLPLKNGNFILRFISNFKFINKVIKFSKINNAKSLIFSSITIPGILVLKLFCLFNPDLNISCVGHTILETIFINKRINYLKIILNNLILKNFILIIYGHNNDKEIIKHVPNIKKNVISIDLPYIFEYIPKNILDNNKITIGSLGIARIDKGAIQLFKIAQAVKKLQLCDNIKFVQIGQVFDIDYKKYTNSIDFPSPEAPINREEFINIGQKIHYSIFCYDNSWYRLIVSASFYDTILLEKPIIAFDTQFFRNYFERFGDIGYLVKNENEMINLIYKINDHFDLDRYSHQCINIRNAKKILSIESIAHSLKKNNISFL